MPEKRRKKATKAGVWKRQRLIDPAKLRRRGLTRFRLTGHRGDKDRVVLACPRGPFKRGACVPQAILHFHG